MPRLFVSYSRVDREFTIHLVDRLRRVYGLTNIWYDDELPGGVQWWQEILRQIGECDVFLYLLSNEAVESPYCQAEFKEAQRLQKPIVTVQVRDRTHLTAELCAIQFVDMHAGIDDANVSRLYGSINTMAAQPAKKRAKWGQPTSLPITADADKLSPAIAQTESVLQPATSPGDRIVARATITAALITGILGIVAVIVSVVLPNLLNPSPTAVPTMQPTAVTVLTIPTVPAQQMLTGTFTVLPTEPVQPPSETPSPIPTTTILPTTATVVLSATAVGVLMSTEVADETVSPGSCPDAFGTAMVYIAAATFIMGSPYQYRGNEYPAHQVRLDAFCMDVYEVTNQQYAACVADGVCTPPRDSGVGANTNYYETSLRFPVVNVDWLQASSYCAYRGGHLPTEAEWELVARYDPVSGETRAYPWGDQSPDPTHANYLASGFSSPIGGDQRPAGMSPYGIYNLSGNVAEWVFDWFAAYNDVIGVNPIGAETGAERVVRGGSYASTTEEIRGGYRESLAPTDFREDIGFRCVIPSQP